MQKVFILKSTNFDYLFIHRNFRNLFFEDFLGCWIQIWGQNFCFSQIQDPGPVLKFRVLRFGTNILNLANLKIFVSDSGV